MGKHRQAGVATDPWTKANGTSESFPNGSWSWLLRWSKGCFKRPQATYSDVAIEIASIPSR